MSHALHRAARVLADQQVAATAAAAGSGAPIIATVTTATAKGAADGLSYLVKVTRRGVATTAAGYLAAYTPTVGDRVLCVSVDNQLIVLGRVVGHP